MSKSSLLMYVAIPHAEGTGTGVAQRIAPLAAASVNGGQQGILLVANQVLSGGGSGAGFPVAIIGLSDADDNVAPITGTFTNLFEGVVSRLTGYNPIADTWSRVTTLTDNNDTDQPNAGAKLGTVDRLTVYDAGGDLWQRVRGGTATNLALQSGIGSVVSTPPGEWAVNSEPAVSTQATATRAAGGAGVRHICKSLHFSLNAVVAQANIYARVRDGASGAGAILWSQCVVAPAGGYVHIELSGLNIVGSPATAMTFEFSAAPAATNFQTAGGSGYDAS